MVIIAALICGLIFGWGLLISEMMQPAKVVAFLDIFGAWDPSLAVVMIAALVVLSLVSDWRIAVSGQFLRYKVSGRPRRASIARW
jgi:uncharacterized membrane protein YedE/YeeE